MYVNEAVAGITFKLIISLLMFGLFYRRKFSLIVSIASALALFTTMLLADHFNWNARTLGVWWHLIAVVAVLLLAYAHFDKIRGWLRPNGK